MDATTIIAVAGLVISIVVTGLNFLYTRYTRRMLIATNVPAVRVTIQQRDTGNQVKSPITVIDLELKNLSKTISVTDIRASIYIGSAEIEGGIFKRAKILLRINRPKRRVPYSKNPLLYYTFPLGSFFLEADKTEVLQPFDGGGPYGFDRVNVGSIEDFLVEKLPHLLQEVKVAIGNELALSFDPNIGRDIPQSKPVIQHQYHHAQVVFVKAVVTYRAEVGGTSTYTGKTVARMLLSPISDEGTKLMTWHTLF